MEKWDERIRDMGNKVSVEIWIAAGAMAMCRDSGTLPHYAGKVMGSEKDVLVWAQHERNQGRLSCDGHMHRRGTRRTAAESRKRVGQDK
jgi:hypothetical protein